MRKLWPELLIHPNWSGNGDELNADYMEMLLGLGFLNHAAKEPKPLFWEVVRDRLTDWFMTLTFWWALDCAIWKNWKEIFSMDKRPLRVRPIALAPSVTPEAKASRNWRHYQRRHGIAFRESPARVISRIISRIISPLISRPAIMFWRSYFVHKTDDDGACSCIHRLDEFDQLPQLI